MSSETRTYLLLFVILCNQNILSRYFSRKTKTLIKNNRHTIYWYVWTIKM